MCVGDESDDVLDVEVVVVEEQSVDIEPMEARLFDEGRGCENSMVWGIVVMD